MTPAQEASLAMQVVAISERLEEIAKSYNDGLINGDEMQRQAVVACTNFLRGNVILK